MKTVKTNTRDKQAYGLCVGFSDRTLQIIETLDLSLNQFCRICEISPSTLSQVLLGKNSISLHTIYKITICFPEINSSWWIENIGGKMFRKKPVITEEMLKKASTPLRKSKEATARKK